MQLHKYPILRNVLTLNIKLKCDLALNCKKIKSLIKFQLRNSQLSPINQ